MVHHTAVGAAWGEGPAQRTQRDDEQIRARGRAGRRDQGLDPVATEIPQEKVVVLVNQGLRRIQVGQQQLRRFGAHVSSRAQPPRAAGAASGPEFVTRTPDPTPGERTLRRQARSQAGPRTDPGYPSLMAAFTPPSKN